MPLVSLLVFSISLRCAFRVAVCRCLSYFVHMQVHTERKC